MEFAQEAPRTRRASRANSWKRLLRAPKLREKPPRPQKKQSRHHLASRHHLKLSRHLRLNSSRLQRLPRSFRRLRPRRRRPRRALGLGLRKTRESFLARIRTALTGSAKLSEIYEGLEEALIGADVGVDTSLKLTEALRTKLKNESRPDTIRDALKG